MLSYVDAEVGLQTFVDLLEFIGSLIMSEGEGIHLGLDVFGLGLLQAALNSGAQALSGSARLPFLPNTTREPAVYTHRELCT